MVKKSAKSKKVNTDQKLHLGKPIIIGVSLFVLVLILSYFVVACTVKYGYHNKSHVAFSLAVLEPNKPEVKEIVNFLKKESLNSRCDIGSDGSPRGYFSVRGYTEDLTQLYLGYGCYSTEASMYAIKSDAGWKTISPTNQFDLHGNPSCEMVDANAIQKSIAPVCWTGSADGSNLDYIVR